LWTTSPKLTATQAMLAAKFTHDDATSKAKIMWVRRRMPKGRKTKTQDQDTPSILQTPSPSSTLTPSPDPSTPDTRQKIELQLHPALKANHKRKKSYADERKRKKAAQEHMKKAHKRATLLYDAEKKKGTTGMSAREVQEIVLQEYDMAPSVRTIQRYSKDGMAGKSPVKKGPKK